MVLKTISIWSINFKLLCRARLFGVREDTNALVRIMLANYPFYHSLTHRLFYHQKSEIPQFQIFFIYLFEPPSKNWVGDIQVTSDAAHNNDGELMSAYFASFKKKKKQKKSFYDLKWRNLIEIFEEPTLGKNEHIAQCNFSSSILIKSHMWDCTFLYCLRPHTFI